MNRWALLAGYDLLAACTQLLWLSYAFIDSQAHRAMGVTFGDVGDLAGIFPLVYAVLGGGLDTAAGGISITVAGSVWGRAVIRTS